MMIDEDDRNVTVFAMESQSEDESTRDRSHADEYMQLFPLYILTLLNVYRNVNDCASQVMQLYDSANESLNAVTSVLLFTFFLWLENCTLFCYREMKRYGLFTSELVGLFVYCVNLCHICMYHSLGL